VGKKKLNTILVFLVVAIWGIVLYKFILSYFYKPETTLIYEVDRKKEPPTIIKKDTVELVFPSRDPFLDKMLIPKEKDKPMSTPQKAVEKRKGTKPVPWPKIDYLGFVKSKKSKTPLGLIRIDGKLHRVTQNSIVKGLKIVHIDGDQITLSNGRDSQNFKKK